ECREGFCTLPVTKNGSHDAGRSSDAGRALRDGGGAPRDGGGALRDGGGAPRDAGSVGRDGGSIRLPDASPIESGVAMTLALCTLPPELGTCAAAFQRFYHDPATHSCEIFTYGGCDGNANNFETLSACETACDVPPSTPCSVEADDA